jgi:hypothetical protein
MSKILNQIGGVPSGTGEGKKQIPNHHQNFIQIKDEEET